MNGEQAELETGDERGPQANGKPVVLLRELAGETGDIEDPAAQGEDVFQSCRDEIVRCLEIGLPRLLER